MPASTEDVKDIHSVQLAIEQGRGQLVNIESLPPLLDLSADTITENAQLINRNIPNARLKFIMEHLVKHLHDFAREVQLQTHEWEAALKFLEEVGKISSPIRAEFILLSDILGLSLLVDSISNPKPEECSEGTILGPFHTDNAKVHALGDSIVSSEEKGDPVWVCGTIKDSNGKPVVGASIDVWETDKHGLYDNQYATRNEPDCRGIVETDENGRYSFRAVVPVPYPIPGDGPVGKLLYKLQRHNFRPSHMHFSIQHKDYEPLVSAIYSKGDPFETTDAVFGVKSSLIQEFKELDEEKATELGIHARPAFILERDWILTTKGEADVLRKLNYDKANVPEGARV